MSGSLTNLLSASQNIVTALNNAQTNANELAGTANTLALTSNTVALNGPGRAVVVSVVIAGSTTGGIYDASTIATATASRLVAVIPQTLGAFTLNMPVAYGIVVKPGTGMTVCVSYS